jgi:5,10-methylene-tetrahydrofolate dehydrogenase/methenyl tetrahydrofolate cyclohydrolase
MKYDVELQAILSTTVYAESEEDAAALAMHEVTPVRGTIDNVTVLSVMPAGE